jgi:hypothetical protein
VGNFPRCFGSMPAVLRAFLRSSPVENKVPKVLLL